MEAEAFRVCVGCSVAPAGGSDFLSASVAVVGAFAGLIGAYAGVQAYIVADRAYRTGIVPEEFSSHRLKLENSLSAIERSLISLRLVAQPVMPFPRIESIFRAAYSALSPDLGVIDTEARRIDERGLFGGRWAVQIGEPLAAIDTNWDILMDDAAQEVRRVSAAIAIVAQLENLISRVRELIDDTVKRPLKTQIKWPWNKD